MVARSPVPDRIAALRLLAQRLSSGRFADVASAARHMLALQAQDFPGACWSLGLRVDGATEAAVHEALSAGSVVRSWPMRGTLHLVPAEDLGWMLALTRDRIVRGAAARHAELGLDAACIERARAAAADALEGRKRHTREQMMALFERHGLRTDGQRGYHLLWHLSLGGTLCFGPVEDGEQALVRLDEWVPRPRQPDREQALGEFASRYFASHGPATIHDFAWWSSLPMKDARLGVAVAGKQLASIELGGTTYLLSPSLLDAEPEAPAALTLPGFDEFLLGYQDRSAALRPEFAARIVPGGNGVFLPPLVVDGQVVGTWRRATRARHTAIEMRPFVKLSRKTKDDVAQAAARYGAFLGRPVEVSFTEAQALAPPILRRRARSVAPGLQRARSMREVPDIDTAGWYALGLPLYAAYVGLEIAASRRRSKAVFGFAETIANLTAGLSTLVVGLFVGPWVQRAWDFAHDRVAPFAWPARGWWKIPAALALADLCFYLYHRAGHRFALFWAIHGIHHQHEHQNSSVGFRIEWLADPYAALFFGLMPLAGVDSTTGFAAITLLSVYSLTTHSPLLPRPSWGLLITPLIHGAHHSRDARFADKNYGAMLGLWDRLFGTWLEPAPSGVFRSDVPSVSRTHDGVATQFILVAELARSLGREPSQRGKLRVLLSRPSLGPPPAPLREDGAIDRRTRLYVLAHFLALTALGGWLLWGREQRPLPAQIACAAVLLAGLSALGGLLDGRAGAARHERARLWGSALVGAGLAFDSPAVGAAVVAGSLGGLLASRGSA